MISRQRQLQIRESAKDFLQKVWDNRVEIWKGEAVPTTRAAMFPLPVGKIITRHLKLKLAQPDFIPPEGDESRVVTLGLMDRKKNEIAIAKGFPVPQRRFTAAHEVGHWLMHKGFVYHRSDILRRDRPISGPNWSAKLQPEEHEANLFAAEVLMPASQLAIEVSSRFGEPIDRRHHHEGLWYWLSKSPGELDPFTIANLTTYQLAFRAAEATAYDDRHFVPLTDRFGVSASAMAIQLSDCSLVS